MAGNQGGLGGLMYYSRRGEGDLLALKPTDVRFPAEKYTWHVSTARLDFFFRDSQILSYRVASGKS
jgi:hypothetical protein